MKPCLTEYADMEKVNGRQQWLSHKCREHTLRNQTNLVSLQRSIIKTPSIILPGAVASVGILYSANGAKLTSYKKKKNKMPTTIAEGYGPQFYHLLQYLHWTQQPPTRYWPKLPKILPPLGDMYLLHQLSSTLHWFLFVV